jgi:hypothetical protein
MSTLREAYATLEKVREAARPVIQRRIDFLSSELSLLDQSSCRQGTDISPVSSINNDVRAQMEGW